MKLLVLYSILTFLIPHLMEARESSSSVYATQGVANIDTLTLGGVRVGAPLRDLIVRTTAKIDTMIWGGKDGVSLLKFTGSAYGHDGEFHIATDGATVHRITFTISATDADSTDGLFTSLTSKFEKRFGEATDEYNNIYRNIRWVGGRQTLAIQTKSNANYVSIVLSETQKR